MIDDSRITGFRPITSDQPRGCLLQCVVILRSAANFPRAVILRTLRVAMGTKDLRLPFKISPRPKFQ